MKEISRFKIKKFLFSVFCFLSITAIAQTSDVFIKGNTPFNISINKIPQHKNYSNDIKISQLQGERNYNFEITFENDTSLIQQKIYLMDNNLAYYYEVNKTALTLKKITPNQLLKKDSSILQISYTSNPIIKTDTIITDTLVKKDTAYVPPFANYYKMENYDGKIACPWPIKAEELTILKGEIKSKNLEDSKLEQAKGRIQYMDSVCITVNQLREILILFQYEETKLDFAKYIAPYIFDIDNVGKLNDVFDFENSIDELKEVINNN